MDNHIKTLWSAILFAFFSQVCLAEVASITVDHHFLTGPHGHAFVEGVQRRLVLGQKKEESHLQTFIIDRKEFRQHLMNRKKVVSRLKVNRLLEHLELEALSNTLMITCYRRQKKYTGCGLYYYNVRKAKIVAQVQRKFKMPITDPTVWAPILTASFLKQARAHNRLQAEKMLQRFSIRKSSSTKVPMIGITTQLAFSMGKPVVSSYGGVSIASIFRQGLGIGIEYDTSEFGIGASMGGLKTSGSRDNEYSEHQYYFYHNASFKAQRSMVWSLTSSLGVLNANLHSQSKTESGSNDSSLAQKWYFLSVGPSLGFDLTNSLTLNQSIRMNWRSKAEESRKLASDNLILRENKSSGLDVIVNLKIIF